MGPSCPIHVRKNIRINLNLRIVAMPGVFATTLAAELHSAGRF